MRLGLVYLPDVRASAAAVRCAEGLVAGRTPRVVLGPTRLPHITLLHLETEIDPARLWADASGLDARLSYRIRALDLLRYDTPYNAPPAPPATMAWLMVEGSPALLEAERRAMAMPSVAAAGRVTTANGERFVPHLTIAIWEGPPASTSAALPAELAETSFEARLALGVIGANGVYERSLFTAPAADAP